MLGSSQAASAFVIDFEQFGTGEIINTQMAAQIPGAPLGLGVTIYADNFNDGQPQTSDVNAVHDPLLVNYLDLTKLVSTDLAVVFDSDNPTGGDSDLGATFTSDFGDGTNDPGNILIMQEFPPSSCNATTCSVPDDEAGRPNGQFIFQFTRPVAIISIDVFDVEAEENEPTDIIMYDVNGNLLPQFSMDNILTTNGDKKWRQIDVNSIRVQTMIIEWAGSGAIDNIVFEIPVGGKILSINSTPLLLEGINTNPYSILGSLTLVGAIAFAALYFTSKKNQ